MIKKPLKIAILSQYLPPVYSGSGRQALRIGMELKKKGNSVFFVTCRPPGTIQYIDTNGINVYKIITKNIVGYRGQISFGIKALKILIKKRNEFDILFSPNMGTLIGFLFYVLKFLKKTVVVRMSLFTDSPNLLRKRKIGPYLLLPYIFSDAIIAPSTARKKDVIEAFPKFANRVFRINNCVDPKLFRPCDDEIQFNEMKRRLSLEPHKKYVSYVGRIIARKGVQFLLEAWKEVVKSYDNAVLLLIGPTDYESKGEDDLIDPLFLKLKEEIAENELESKVLFIGETDKVHEYLKISDVFVFASKAEGLPSAPIEAMAAEIPVVVLEIKDIMSDIIDSGKNGFIVPNEDKIKFSKQIVILLQDKNYRNKIGIEARRKVLKEFSIQAVGNEYMELFYYLFNMKQKNRSSDIS